MTRITKEIAHEVAVKMTVKKVNELEKLRSELQKTIYDWAIQKVPADVMKCYRKHKEHFSTASSVKFTGNGFQYESFGFGFELPLHSNTFMPDDNIAKPVRMAKNEIDKKEKSLKQLRSEIENSLYNLKSYKAVEAEFPEAFKLLPKTVCTSLIINIDSIREKLK